MPDLERITSEWVVSAARLVADARHQLAVGDAGGGEEHVVRGDQVVGGEHPVEVVPGVERLAPLGVVLGRELAQDHAAEALERAGRDDALRGAADAEHQVDAGVRAGRHDRAGHVPVGDQVDPGAGRADRGDQALVPGPVEDDHGDVVRRDALGLGDRGDVRRPAARRCPPRAAASGPVASLVM